MFRAQDFPINAYLEALEAEYRRKGQVVEFEPFAYNAEYLPLNAATSLNFVNATDADSSFACFLQMRACYDVASAVFIPYPNALVQITKDAGGVALQDRPTHVTNIFGRAERPFVLIRPWVIGPKSSWTTTASNQETTINFNLRLTFWGVKIRLTPAQ